MDITPRELRDTEIHEAFRGYNRDEVNDLLERAADALEEALGRARELSDRLASAQSEAGRTRETEDILHRTLLLAQRAADEAVAEAQARARQMVDEAEISARKLLAEAESDARRRGEAERRRLEEEILELAGRRDALLADVEALTRFETDYRERMMRALESDLTSLRSRPSLAGGSRPEVSEVELPVATEGLPRREAARPDQRPTDEDHEPAPAPAATEPDAIGRDRAERDEATREVDVRALFESEVEAIASSLPTSAPAATASTAAPADAGEEPEPGGGGAVAERPAAATAAGAGPIDLNGDELVEAEVLDDDAFFATLRDAVHDDSPLGPRDDEDDRLFFDDEEQRSSFRDVFRRRR